MCEFVSFRENGSSLIPAFASANGFETPIWQQSEWTEGPYAEYVRKNGCGHCCCAMAARLHGVEIDPAGEFDICVKLWDEPDEEHDWFQTARGIADVLRSLGVEAASFGVPSDEEGLSGTRSLIGNALSAGRQVIFWSHPRDEYNIFSHGEHYVLAAGYDEAGNVVVLNSGKGVQLSCLDTIMESVFRGSGAGLSGWGTEKDLSSCGGLVIV